MRRNNIKTLVKKHKKRKVENDKQKEEKVEVDQTVTWEYAKQVTAEESIQYVKQLLGSCSLETLENHVSEMKPLHVKNSRSLLHILNGVQALGTIVTNQKLYLKRDLRFTRYEDEEDALLDSTPEAAPVTMKTVQQFIKDEWAVHVRNIDSFSESVAECLQMVDTYWNGQGGCFANVTYTPEGVAAYPPYAEINDKLILQIEGSQKVFVYNPMEANEETSFGYVHHGPNPIVIHEVADVDVSAEVECDIMLEAGDLLYVPAGYIVFSDAETNSLDLAIGLTAQPRLTDYLNDLIAEATKRLNIPKQIFKKAIHSTESTTTVEGIRATGRSVLTESLKYEQDLIQKLQARTLYQRVHFNTRSWMRQYNLRSLLKKNNGIVKISNFLPTPVADRIYQSLEAINEKEWILTEAKENLKRNNINHAFMSSRSFPNHDAIFSIFRQLIPECEDAFSAGRYTNQHYIDPHDDRQYKDIDGNLYSREIAVIYYLTPNWSESDGGALVDIEGDKKYIPEYNSVISFTIPRWHQVEPCLSNKPRYSIFGWFFQPGKLYELNTGDGEEMNTSDY